jgi:transcriptional regulator with XRE-family HTH domain
MPRPRRRELQAEARRRNLEQLARLGAEVRSSRRRRLLSQAELGAWAGISQSTVSQVERGDGRSLSLDVWQRIFTTLGRPLIVEAGRDSLDEPADAGHLAIQQLVLRLARANGIRAAFELPLPSAPGRHSVDVFVRDDRGRRLLVIECVNTLGDIGAAVRALGWKLTKAQELAATLPEPSYKFHGCWVMRASRRNRELVRRYPEVFGSRFPGSSMRWMRALAEGFAPPAETGLVWSDIACTRLLEWRQRGPG